MTFTKSDAPLTELCAEKKYSIVAKHSGKCIAPISTGYVDGTNIVQKTFRQDDAAALWTVSGTDGGYWNLSLGGTGKSMTCRANKYIQLFDYNNSSALQSWTLNFIDPSHFSIGAKGTGKVIEVKDGSLDENASLALASYSGADNQLFSLVDNGTGTGVANVNVVNKVWLSSNPFKDKVVIRVPTTSTVRRAQLDIYAVNGARVFSEVVPVTGPFCAFCWQPEDAHQGVYIYKVQVGNSKASGKLVRI